MRGSTLEQPTPLVRAHHRLIARRLPLFSAAWMATLAAWAFVLTFDASGVLWLAPPVMAFQLATLVLVSIQCRRTPTARRVRLLALAACIALGASSTALFAAVGGSAEALAFVLLTLYLSSALLFAWGWGAELVLLATTLAVWVLAFPALHFVMSTSAFATAVVIGAVVALATAEGSARTFSLAFLHRMSDEERKRELEASRDAYRDLTENARDFIYTSDLEMRMTYVNEALARFIGEPVEQILGRPLVRLVTDDPANPIPADVFQRVVAREAVPPLLFQLRSGDDVRWVEAILSAIEDADGRVVGLRGISRDVTERKVAEDGGIL